MMKFQETESGSLPSGKYMKYVLYHIHYNTSCLHINSDVNKSVKTGHKTDCCAVEED